MNRREFARIAAGAIVAAVGMKQVKRAKWTERQEAERLKFNALVADDPDFVQSSYRPTQADVGNWYYYRPIQKPLPLGWYQIASVTRGPNGV